MKSELRFLGRGYRYSKPLAFCQLEITNRKPSSWIKGFRQFFLSGSNSKIGRLHIEKHASGLSENLEVCSSRSIFLCLGSSAGTRQCGHFSVHGSPQLPLQQVASSASPSWPLEGTGVCTSQCHDPPHGPSLVSVVADFNCCFVSHTHKQTSQRHIIPP